MSPSNLDTMLSTNNTRLSRLRHADEIALVGSALPPIPAPIPSVTYASGVKSSLIDFFVSGNLDSVALEQSLLIDGAAACSDHHPLVVRTQCTTIRVVQPIKPKPTRRYLSKKEMV
jgi:hypothetical protein